MARADHLFVQYPGFTHHGMDLGDGTVIEYGGKGTSRMSVRQIRLVDFAQRGEVYIRQYAPGQTLPDDDVIRLAWTRLHEQRYDLFNNNCEHLAYWCKTGNHLSPQSETLKGAIAVGAVVGGLMLLANAMEDESPKSGNRKARG